MISATCIHNVSSIGYTMPCGLAIIRLRCLEIAIHDSGVCDARSGLDDSIATWAVVPACIESMDV